MLELVGKNGTIHISSKKISIQLEKDNAFLNGDAEKAYSFR